ncbi:L-fucose:H+ symporter permease [Mariniphaga sediminis]|uniref:L-fucose:H+ symporter permease n=1 Tax=Mariniphaga sediminis TaxID=1628158 RepID=UPI0035625D3D
MNQKKRILIPGSFLLPYILTTICFPFWGFGENVTNPLVHAFPRILNISHFEGSLIQFAFYGGYFAMALPAALFIKRFSYKSGILMGLFLYATGALLFIPASTTMMFGPFLLAYFVLTCGLSFLETSANPYVLSLGPEETATRRLNLSQAFGPMGSLVGMFTAQQVILKNLSTATAEERMLMSPDAYRSLTMNDLSYIRLPYVAIAGVLVILFIIIALAKLPSHRDQGKGLDFIPTVNRLFKKKRYYEGVIAQFFYVGAQIMVWTFIIHYAVSELGFSEAKAQSYNIAAMVVFVFSRFICTFFLKYISPSKLLLYLAMGGMLFTLGAIFLHGVLGLYSLIAISACMSLMFPTIYGIALRGIGEDAKIGAAGLIMAILGGSVMPPVMGAVIDLETVFSFSAIRFSFFLPFICFVVVAVFGYRGYKVFHD